MASLRLDFQSLYNKVSDFLGTGSSPTGTPLANAKALVNRAYRQLLFPVDATGKKHTWSFLKKYTALNTSSEKWKYQLPADFGYMLDTFHFDDQDGYPPMTKVDPGYILQQRNYSDTESYPRVYAIVPVKQDIEIGTYYELWLWPEPSTAFLLHYGYVIQPQKLEESTDVPLGGPEAHEVLMEMSMAVAETEKDDTIGIHNQLAEVALQKLIVSDKTITAPDSVGMMRDSGRGKFEYSRWLVPLTTSEVYVGD